MAAEARTWIQKYPKGRQQSAVIPLLMLAQEQEGWVTKAAIEHVAAMLEMPHIRVLEVATFYTQFQLKPVGTRAHVQVCGTTPCQIMGAEKLMDVCRSKIHHDQFHTNADGTLSWEEVECLGACVNAPMVMIFKDTYEDLTPERLAEIIDEFEAGKGDKVKTGPQIDRWFSAPAGGFTSLANEKAVTKAAGSKSAKAPKAAAASPDEPAVKVPPSNAARPKTVSLMTSPAVKTPSKVKASPVAEKAVSAPSPKAKAWADVSEAEKKATKPTPAAPVKVEKPSLDSTDRPKGIERPRSVDDLKLISGVGPKIEKTLHDLGIFTYALGRHRRPSSREGPRLDRQRDEGVGPARPWRRGLPDRPEMVLHAEAVRWPAAAIWSSTPTSPSRAPARTARSCGTIRIR
jgi:NADH-quinone oxidoreductase subunit E